MDTYTARARAVVESRRFEHGITVLIVLNAIVLGLETVPEAMEEFGPLLTLVDGIILGVFTVEVVAKLLVYRLAFASDPWRVFDLLIVSFSLIPASGNLSVLRALRILRVFRLVSTVPSLRRVVGGLMAALPGMGSILVLLSLVFYVFSVMATKLYGDAFPDWFGSIPASAYSLFQIMTLESWSMGIVRPVMSEFPFAWAFFVPFIVATSFTVLNLFIGIIVSAMQRDYEAVAAEERGQMHSEQTAILAEIKALRAEVAELRSKPVRSGPR